LFFIFSNTHFYFLYFIILQTSFWFIGSHRSAVATKGQKASRCR